MKLDSAPLWRWARIREKVRERKESGQRFPWCNDEIIRTYRFCEVRREDDRVTRWIDQNIRRRFAGHKDLWLMLCIARAINWTPTLAALIEFKYIGAWPRGRTEVVYSPLEFMHVLDAQEKAGHKVFTGAYIITAPPTKGTKKSEFVARSTIGELWKARSVFREHFHEGPQPTLQQTHKLLMEYPGWGNFMAFQVVMDLCFTDLLADAPDRYSWAAAGPGTIRGLNRLHGRDLKYALRQDDALDEIREIYGQRKDEIDFHIEFSDVTGMLCETDKYLRVLNKEGTPRAKYVPGRGY